MKLFEGLREGDLEGLVLPLLSLDEFETKLDDDAIVVAFFVQDREPANDLNRFIQKGSVPILDTDVSPAPNEDGYYLVFVELERNSSLPERVMYILNSLEGLTSIKTWTGNFFEQDGVHNVTEETLNDLLRLVSEDAESESVAENLHEFFRESALEDVQVRGRIVTLEGLYDSFSAEIIDFGSFDEVKQGNVVLEQALRLDEEAQHNVRSIQRLLGDHWLVEHLQEHILISQPWAGDQVLLLRI